jgi:hypothetical protein
MNEFTKPIHDIGDNIPLETVFVDALTGVPTNPTTATLILEKDGVELLRYVSPTDPELTLPGNGLARVWYRALPDPGAGRYSFRFFGVGVVTSAAEDWFYIRKSAFTNPIEE